MSEPLVARCTHSATGRPSCPTPGLAVALVALCVALPRVTPLCAQSAPWTTARQAASWCSVFADHAVTERTALWFDGQWRRMGIGREPQQLLLRPGIIRTIVPGVRVGAGYAYVATAPYGEVPIAAPLREHRAWQQVMLSHRAGPLSVSHRYRWEQRWLASLLPSPDGDHRTGPWGYQQRARYMVRAQGALPGLEVDGRPVLVFGWDELLMPVGHGDASVRLTQNRLGGGIGVPVSARQRLEVGYMNLWNALPAARANEVNHTFTATWVWTSTR
jgi:hypothetical protein